MPYYGNSYQDGQQPYEFSFQQPMVQSPQSNSPYNQIRVNVPPRTSQDFPQIPVYSTNFEQSPIHQRAQQGFYYESPVNTPQYHNQQVYNQHNQQLYAQRNQAYDSRQDLPQQFIPQPQQYQQYYQEPQQQRQVSHTPIQQQSQYPQQQIQGPPIQVQQQRQQQNQVNSAKAYQQQQQPKPTPIAYNEQQQKCHPPPPPRVIVPPLPEQAFQTPKKPSAQTSTPTDPVRMPVVNIPVIKQEIPQSRILQDSKSNLSRPANTMKPSKQSNQPIQSIHHPSILLSLADEYLETARKLDERTKEYYELVSTGVGCLEVALKQFKLAPLREAQVALKYAQILYDETNNLDEAETTLTRSIDLCSRMKFIDLKYSMQLLLAKVLFRSKPRAAIRDLQNMIQDIETFGHTAWEYLFRLQAVSFDLQVSQSSNLHDATNQLGRIQQLAKKSRDNSVYAFAALVESYLHLKNVSNDGPERAQECLAKFRSMQLDTDVQDHPQMSTMREVIDLIWSMSANIKNDDIMTQKRENYTKVISAHMHDESKWSPDEFLRLKISNSSFKGIPTQDGGLFEERNGTFYVVISWMTRSEIEAMGYLVKGISLKPMNQHLQGRAERYLAEGYKIPDSEMPDPPATQNGRLPMKPITIKQQNLVDRTHILAAQFQLELALVFIGRGLLKKASDTLTYVDNHLSQLTIAIPIVMLAMMDYIKGCINQAEGEIDEAISHYQSQHLLLPIKNQGQARTTSTSSTLLDLQILAAINTAFIICPATHPQHSSFNSLVENISSHITANTPKPVSSVYNILLTSLPTATMLQCKQLLSQVMAIASQLRDQQLTSLCLTLIQEKFFRGGVQHPQAIKSARAASHQVKTKWGNPMWCAIAGTMDVESMILQMGVDGTTGGMDEVNARVEEIRKAWATVPKKVRDALQTVD